MMTMQFENQKRELQKSLHLKKEKKKETMTLRIKQKEQSMTSHMVAKQSEQMLELLAQKKEDLRKELEQELEAQVSQADEMSWFTDDNYITLQSVQFPEYAITFSF